MRGREHDDARPFQNFGLNLIWLQIYLKVPVLDFFRIRYHLIKRGNTLDAVIGLLEKTLSNISHNFFVLPNLWWNSNQYAKLRREINILLFLFDFKERLIWLANFGIILGEEVVQHLHLFVTLLALIEGVRSRCHFPAYSVNFICALKAIIGHNDGSFKIAIYQIIVFKALQTFRYNC